jgi:predicted negative regulator of RcsB-dependent stress response
MAIQNKTNVTLFQIISDRVNENIRPIVMVLSFVLVLISLFFAHKLWTIRRERSTQYDFTFLMTEYETMSREKNPQWSELLEKFEKNYEKHASSSLLPYYLSYKVQILLEQDKKDEALATLDTMIAGMPGSPMLALYEMERALIQIDTMDSELQNTGVEALKVLVNDTDNMFRDSAQYYLGRYYWAHNQIDDARHVWQQLVDEQRDEKIAPSPWVEQVQGQLRLTIV